LQNKAPFLGHEGRWRISTCLRCFTRPNHRHSAASRQPWLVLWRDLNGELAPHTRWLPAVVGCRERASCC
jgi:hypothetical protein